MNRIIRLQILFCLCLACSGFDSTSLVLAADFDRSQDPRNILTGNLIPDEEYCDQPYVVVTAAGDWVCLLTTGPGGESSGGLHVVSAISRDQGNTWSKLVPLEPGGEQRSYWGTPFITPYGRIYAFYGWETVPVKGHVLKNHPENQYVFKFSDDGGKTWSGQHQRIPMRPTALDKEGRIDSFWGIDSPIVQDGAMYFAFTRLAPVVCGEGWVLKSDNILTEKDPEQLHWELLPEGDQGIRNADFGTLQDEHNIVPLGNNSLFCVYRRNGYTPLQSYSRDGGRTWSTPQEMTYGPGQRPIKHPRACPKLFQAGNGKYLLWFHNNSSTGTRHNRNPVFLTGGTLMPDGFIHWSEPELILYDPFVSKAPEPSRGISYPCFIEHAGRFWVTETQKREARVHELDATLLQGLWDQPNNNTLTRDGLLCEYDQNQLQAGQIDMPDGLDPSKSGGLTLEMIAQLDSLDPGQILLDSRDDTGRGICIHTTTGHELSPPTDETLTGSIQLDLSDGEYTASWDVDPGQLQPGKRHHLVFVLDQGPRIISAILDGHYCDGNLQRKFGWGRYEQDLANVKGLSQAQAASPLKLLRIYNRPLRTSQVVGNFHGNP